MKIQFTASFTRKAKDGDPSAFAMLSSEVLDCDYCPRVKELVTFGDIDGRGGVSFDCEEVEVLPDRNLVRCGIGYWQAIGTLESFVDTVEGFLESGWSSVSLFLPGYGTEALTPDDKAGV